MASYLLDSIRPYLPKFIDEIDSKHALRLIIIVGAYFVLRSSVSRYLTTKQLKDQLEKDDNERDQEKIRQLIDDPNTSESASGVDDNAFGFGKRTRKVVQRKQKILQEELERLQNGEEDDDKDIEYLLEDD